MRIVQSAMSAPSSLTAFVFCTVFWIVLAAYKIAYKLMEPKTNSFSASMEKHERDNNKTQRNEDEEDWHGLQTTNLKNLGGTFQDAPTVDALSVTCALNL